MTHVFQDEARAGWSKYNKSTLFCKEEQAKHRLLITNIRHVQMSSVGLIFCEIVCFCALSYLKIALRRVLTRYCEMDEERK